ncbi:hypothetical protein ACLOJK_014770, partial [Asimina triloba]
MAKGERCFFYELQEIRWRANHVVALEAKAVDATKLSDRAVVRVKRDEAVNGAKAAKEEVSGLLTKLAAARFEAKALHPQDVDSDVNGGQVALLGSREAEPLFESKAARTEEERLQAKLEELQAKVACLLSSLVVTGHVAPHRRFGGRRGRRHWDVARTTTASHDPQA